MLARSGLHRAVLDRLKSVVGGREAGHSVGREGVRQRGRLVGCGNWGERGEATKRLLTGKGFRMVYGRAQAIRGRC